MPSKRRIVDDALYAHFVTFSVFRRRRFLDHDHPKQIVLGVLNSLLIEGDARYIGFVVMLDHIFANTQTSSRQCVLRVYLLLLRNTGRLSTSNWFHSAAGLA
jgi:hypothetical protein